MRIRAKTVTKAVPMPVKPLEGSPTRVRAVQLPLMGEALLHGAPEAAEETTFTPEEAEPLLAVDTPTPNAWQPEAEETVSSATEQPEPVEADMIPETVEAVVISRIVEAAVVPEIVEVVAVPETVEADGATEHVESIGAAIILDSPHLEPPELREQTELERQLSNVIEPPRFAVSPEVVREREEADLQLDTPEPGEYVRRRRTTTIIREPELEPEPEVEPPTPQPPPIPPEQPTQIACPGRPYTVRRGDSFQLIARRFGVSVRALLDANAELQPGRLMVGDVLCIPQTGESVPAADPPRPIEESDRHLVADGESIADILMKRDVSLNAFQAANPRLRLGYQRVGDLLRMPPRGTRGLCAQGTAYRIVEQEHVSALAQRLGVTVGALLRANPHLLPSDFQPDQVICVPKH